MKPIIDSMPCDNCGANSIDQETGRCCGCGRQRISKPYRKPHRPDFTDADLDGGKYRPLWEGEATKTGDEFDANGRWIPFETSLRISAAADHHVKLRRRVEKARDIPPMRSISNDLIELRDYFAAQAIGGLISTLTPEDETKDLRLMAAHFATASYAYADAMLAERAKKPAVLPDH